MRISTSQYYAENTQRILDTQSKIFKTQEQVSSGVRVDTPSEDPLALAISIRAKNSLSRIGQYERNMVFGQNFLSEMEGALTNASDAMQTAKEKLVAASNGTLAQDQKRIIATELDGLKKTILSAANGKDAGGSYIFSGTTSLSRPFEFDAAITPNLGESVHPAPATAAPAGGYAFLGTNRDNGAVVGNAKTGIDFQIADGRTLDLDINGQDAFSYTTFPVQLDATNNPVLDADGRPVLDNTQPKIRVNVFDVLDRAIQALNNDDPNSAKIVRNAMLEFDRVFTNLQITRTEVGNRQVEIESVRAEFTAIIPELERVSSEAIDTNMAKAISDLARDEFQLKAQQQSFANTTRISLFDYLR